MLNTDTDPATRAEMFARINRAGTAANEAEIRRGSLPGPVTNLIKDLAETSAFAMATPLSKQAVDQREREELVTRFFAYVNTSAAQEGRFVGYRDRPKKFLYDYLKKANAAADADPELIGKMRSEFDAMLKFVSRTFPSGFQKRKGARAVPRVRFEAISVGSALALRENPQLAMRPADVENRMRAASFDNIVVSDGANVRAKLEGRIDLVMKLLTKQ